LRFQGLSLAFNSFKSATTKQARMRGAPRGSHFVLNRFEGDTAFEPLTVDQTLSALKSFFITLILQISGEIGKTDYSTVSLTVLENI